MGQIKKGKIQWVIDVYIGKNDFVIPVFVSAVKIKKTDYDTIVADNVKIVFNNEVGEPYHRIKE